MRGCELWLFQPRKVGNMDCTFCLDCIHACPYDNVGIIGRVPTSELWRDPFRSGIGRFSQRLDLAALVALFVFGSFINAFAMIRPVYALRDQIGRWLGQRLAHPRAGGHLRDRPDRSARAGLDRRRPRDACPGAAPDEPLRARP